MEKIAILTNHMEFNPGFSLTGIIQDQARMLMEHGHDVSVFVNSKYHGEDIPGLTLVKKVPFAHLKDYQSINDLTPDHKGTVQETKEMLISELKGYDIAFTHDFVFQGWFLPYGLGCRAASTQLPNIKWMHWIHSIPNGLRDWWDVGLYTSKHRLIYPNKTDSLLVAEQFRGSLKHVRAVHHIKDLRSWFDFCPESCEFIKQYPNVMQADIVQIYPASVDRLSAKRVKAVIQIFAGFKKMKRSVCLVIANQWATTKQHKQNIDNYKRFAIQQGLVPEEEVIFTSSFQPPKYEVGIPKQFLRDLFTCSNVFIFPTREETFGLVLPEASLTSGCLTVCNKSLGMLAEVEGNHGLYHDFGSFHHDFHIEGKKEKYYFDLSKIILGRLARNESIQTKTFMRQKYNWDYLYNQEYVPLFAESEGW